MATTSCRRSPSTSPRKTLRRAGSWQTAPSAPGAIPGFSNRIQPIGWCDAGDAEVARAQPARLDRFARIAPDPEDRAGAPANPTLTDQDVARWWAIRNRDKAANLPRGEIESHWRIATRVGKSPSLADSAKPDLLDFRFYESPPGHYYADPFLIQEAGKHWLFFEDYRYAGRIGVLACARYRRTVRVGAAQTILERPYHLSYPCLLRQSGELYMLPETLGNGAVELYRCARFPDRWEPVRCCFAAAPSTAPSSSETGSTGCSPASWIRTRTVVSCTCSMRAISRRVDFAPANPLSSDIRFNRGAGAVVSQMASCFHRRKTVVAATDTALSSNEIARLTPEEYSERCASTIEPSWAPGLSGCHTYAICGDVEAIDVAAKLPRSLVAPNV